LPPPVLGSVGHCRKPWPGTASGNARSDHGRCDEARGKNADEKALPIICELPVQSDGAAPTMGQRPSRRQNQNSQFQGCRLPTAQSLPVSPHREFGVSHRQLNIKLYLLRERNLICIKATFGERSRRARAAGR
jgi:hypothetical protein